MSATDQTYLLAIARILRDDVAPQVAPGYGRLALLACRHMLLRLAHPQADTLPPLPLAELPPALRDALSRTSSRAMAPHETPAENTALSTANAGMIDEAVSWIGASQWKASERGAIATLVDWEGQMQDAMERLHESLDAPKSREAEAGLLIDPKAVEAYFRTRYGSQVRLTSFTQLLGGRSKQTALLSVEGAVGIPSELVVRRDQSAQIKTGSIVQEYPVLQAVYEAGVAVPQPILLETSLAPLGKAFAVLGRVHGQSLGTHFDVPADPKIAFGLAEQLARLHAIPASRFAGMFGDAPLVDSIERRREQLTQMRESWMHLVKTPSITMTAAFRWLKDNLECAEGELSLVHGDLGFHNFMFEGDRFVALLDWETAHIEHPAGDLGYLRPAIEKMLPWREFFDRYLAAGGRRVTPRQLHFFGIWEILRINIALRHCRVLFETGATDDPMLGEVGAYYVPRFVHRISQHLRRALHDEE